MITEKLIRISKKMFPRGKSFLAAVLTFAMMFSLLPTYFSSVVMAEEIIFVSDRTGLEKISGSNSYRLTADIDLAGADWIPLEAFSGTLNGAGHVISNLSITDTTGNNKGLFASINEGAKVYDLGIQSANITANDNTGVFAGENLGMISCCYAMGTINGGNYVGGIVGINGGSIENCYSKVSVSGKEYLGGLAGENTNQIKMCYAASTVMDSVMNNYLEFYTTKVRGKDVGGYIDILHNPVYSQNAFTLEAWFQWDKCDTDAIEFIIGKGFERFEIHTGGGAGKNGLRFIPVPGAHNDNPYRGGYEKDAYIDVHNVLQKGWFHVAAVYWYDGEKEEANAQVFINGNAQDLWQIPSASSGTAINVGKTARLSRTTNPLSDTNNNNRINIGRRTDNSYYFTGKIADVRFWNIARTEEEIKANKDKVLSGTEAGLVGYWKLNESGDLGAIDSSTTKNNGSIIGTVRRTVATGGAVYKGGFVGSNSGTVTHCYYDSTIYGSSLAVTDLMAKTSTDMKQQATYSNWDFEKTWKIVADNYPILKAKAGVEVNHGTTDKEIAVEGDIVTITADKRDSGWKFKEWIISPGVTFIDPASKTSMTAKFTMPSVAVKAEATYEEVTKTTNSFTKKLVCQGFTYSGDVAQASATAAFGSPVFVYYTNKECTLKTATEDGATVAGGAPKNAGTYYVKAIVNGTDTYTSLESDAVSFVIEKASQETPAVTHTDVSYTGLNDGIIHAIKNGMEWTTAFNDESSWKKTTAEQVAAGKITGLGTGTYYIRVEGNRNHKDSDPATVVIDSKMKKPVKVLLTPPVYDTKNLDKVTVKGAVVKGDYEIISQSFHYSKVGSNEWMSISTIGSDVILTGLNAGTIYELKLTATDSHGNTATDIQKFKTLQASTATGKITGRVDGDQSKKFSVSLKTGSTTVGTWIGLNQDDLFTFTNLEDGEYNLEVTDGEFRVTIMVTVKNGSTENLGVVKVTKKQIVVAVKAGAPNVAIGGLSEVFHASIITGNTDATNVLDNAGTIELRLTASETTLVENITKIKSQSDADGKEIGMMTDLNVDMIVIPFSGESTTSSIIDTEELILIAIPLLEGAKGKTGYQAYRVHAGETQTLAKLTSTQRDNRTKEGFYVEGDYLYVVARYFSSYALAYDKPSNQSKPIDFATPTDISKPIDASLPKDPSDQTDQGKPIDQNIPIGPSKPKTPSAQTNPEKPASQGKPETPNEPASQEKPETSNEPASQEKPGASNEPASQGKPETSNEPASQGKPETSNEPVSQEETENQGEITGDHKSEDTNESTKISKAENSTEIDELEKPDQNVDSMDIAKIEDSSNSMESQTDREIEDSMMNRPQDEADSPIKKNCNLHWYMLLLMACFVSFVMIGKQKSMKTILVVFVVDVILSLILVVFGSCERDILIAAVSLGVAAVSVPAKGMLCKNKRN